MREESAGYGIENVDSQHISGANPKIENIDILCHPRFSTDFVNGTVERITQSDLLD